MSVAGLEAFGAAARTWFGEQFPAPTPVQASGWPAIARGDHALLTAPTGSGKTLAAFLWGIDRLAARAPESPPGVRVLYVSPLKALAYDVERNLRAPLAGIARTAERLGLCAQPVAVAMRTGDTPQRERQRQLRTPGDILVTTPESLYLLLGSRARATLTGVDTVIVDEIHAVLATKRGAHLALSLERLADLTGRDPQRIGLSATVHPLEEAAAFLGGDRAVTTVDAASPPVLDLRVSVPVPDMERVPEPPQPPRGGPVLAELYTRPEAGAEGERGIWSALHPELVARIRGARSTLVFVNNRGLCERLTQRLNALAGEELVLAHHGSVSHARRAEIEDRLKAGAVRGIVSTSSLELGIDMGAVDQVLLVESPGSAARGLQRVGRAGHGVSEVSVGRIYPKFRGDLLECAVVARHMLQGALESSRMPRNALDVLAQQVTAMICDRPRPVADVAALVRRAAPYRGLGDAALHGVLDMLSGAYPAADFAELRPRLHWDRATDRLSALAGSALAARVNAGTIPDRGAYPVVLGAEGPRVGELDEEMVFETRVGETVLLGASTWRVEAITRDRVVVSPAPGEPGKMPFWRGEGPGRPVELGRAIGAFVRALADRPPAQRAAWLEEAAPLDGLAAGNLARYVEAQRDHTGTLPTDRELTVERFRDELGDWRVCVLSPFGARVHGPWAMALQRILGARAGFELQVLYSDDGIVLRLADSDEAPELEDLFPDPEEVEDLVTEQLPDTALFAGLFRENAVRALLLTRRRPGQRMPLWAQRMKAQSLLATVRRYPGFPIVLETYRQCLQDVMDLGALRGLLRDVQARRVRVREVHTPAASPFARSLVFAWVAAYLYEQDAPAAERKAQALTLDRGLLRELLGQAELRELLEPAALEQVERELQRLADGYRATDAEAVHGLLRRLGELSVEEIQARSDGPAGAWLVALAQARRAVPVTLAGAERWIAAEDAGLYRDALGCVPPAGLPEAHLRAPADPLESLVRRHARTHGPFTTGELAARLGLPQGPVLASLRLLEREGALSRGEIRPGGATPEWCDPEVLRRIKRLTLASLRHQVAPVGAEALGRFLPQWHGLDRPRPGLEGLEQALQQLEGLALPWSVLTTAVLPARVQGFDPGLLDVLASQGIIVWVGRGASGPRDGRVVIGFRERAGVLLSPPEAPPEEAGMRRTLVEHLAAHGASFLTELEAAVRAAHPGLGLDELRAALWDLVWAGRITNDTFAPLRSLAGRRPAPGRGRRLETLAGGRWSLVESLRGAPAPPTERAVAVADMLLRRHGVVSREAAGAEEVAGGFQGLYPVLKHMEEAGKVRRGYFVEGLSGAQFAYRGAVEALRAAAAEDPDADAPDARLLAAVDPANPYGALLPWPDSPPGAPRPRRAPGAWVVLVDGALAVYAGARGRRVTTFGGGDEVLVAGYRALAAMPRPGAGRHLTVEAVDGVAVQDSAQLPRLEAAGFRLDYAGATAPFLD